MSRLFWAKMFLVLSGSLDLSQTKWDSLKVFGKGFGKSVFNLRDCSDQFWLLDPFVLFPGWSNVWGRPQHMKDVHHLQGMHWGTKSRWWEHHYSIEPCLERVLFIISAAATLYSLLCCLMPSPIPLPTIGSKSGLLRLVSATVSKSLLVPDTSVWGVDTHSNVICNVCLSTSLQLEESPREEILHQCRPDYRSERDQCQKAQSGVMWPNGETSRGLFNGNEYTMWAQGGMRGRVGSRDQNRNTSHSESENCWSLFVFGWCNQSAC